MTRRSLLLVLIAGGAAALFVRFGFWQLDRRAQRLALNATVEARHDASPVPFSQLPPDAELARFRRVQLSGILDYDHEFVRIGRSRQGSPGVHLVTPLRPLDEGTTVLVNRGWVYSPDGAAVDQERWREGDTVSLEGYVDSFSPNAAPNAAPMADRRALRWLSRRYIESQLPYPIAPVLVVVTSESANPEGPARLESPTLDQGPHLGYALQWFSFAAISIIGVGALLWIERRERTGGAPATGPLARAQARSPTHRP